MPDLAYTRAEILDTLWLKHQSGQLKWAPRTGENSFETDLSDFAFHIDQKSSGNNIRYRIWVFDSNGDDIDNFDPAAIDDYEPDDKRYSSYVELTKALFNGVKESFTLAKLGPALQKLKSFGEDG
jgi:hypothetical protein